jgi:hypothetical protein
MGDRNEDAMSVRILHDEADEQAVLYCSTTGWAFGPVFGASDDKDARERAEAFLRWLVVDARDPSEKELERRYSDWQAQEATQEARERLWALEKDEALDVLVDEEVAELAALRARADLR